jgi:hypothetical protein
MERHLRLLGWLFLIGVFLGLPGTLLKLARPTWEPDLLEVAWQMVGLGAAVLQLLAGLSLVLDLPGRRPLAYAGCVLWLLSFPVGTFLGFYALWALAESDEGRPAAGARDGRPDAPGGEARAG